MNLFLYCLLLPKSPLYRVVSVMAWTFFACAVFTVTLCYLNDTEMKQCDFCFVVIEGRVGNYCSEYCEQAHAIDLGIAEDEDPEDDEPIQS
jgi:hypothetical protein